MALPGLLVQLLKNELMIQYYAMFWKDQETTLIEILKQNLPEIKDIWIQERNFDQAKAVRCLNVAKNSSEFTLKEFALITKLKLISIMILVSIAI